MDALTLDRLGEENEAYSGTAGVSVGGRALGFRPAFLDRTTRIVYPSRYGDGRLAAFHVLDGLPRSLVVVRRADGRVVGVRTSVITGFIRGGRFYTRKQAAREAARG
jgi:hypothetical protein